MIRRILIMLIVAIVSICLGNFFPVGYTKKTLSADAMKVISMRAGKTKKYVYKKSRKVRRWKSSNTKVVTLKKVGRKSVKIKAKRKGNAVITGYTSRGKIKIKIRVKKKKSASSANDNSNNSSSSSSSSAPTVSSSDVHKKKLEENIAGSVQRLSSGKILFKVTNNNNEFIYKADVTFGLYDYEGNYLDKYVVNAKYLYADGGFYFDCTNPEPYWGADSALEKVVFSKIKVIKVEVTTDENCHPMTEADIMGEVIEVQENDKNKRMVQLKSNASKSAWVEWTVIYEDESGNIVDAYTNYGSKTLNSGEKYNDYIDEEINHYYTQELITYEKVKVFWNAADKL